MIVPDAIEPVLGWRAWYMRGDLLASVHHPVRWMPGEPVLAEHTPSWLAWIAADEVRQDYAHEAPRPGCTCGIYAVTTYERLRLQFLMGMPEVYGLVSMWGVVVPAEHGWRAQYAYPFELHVTDPALVRPLRKYGVAVVVEGDREEQ